MLEEGNVESKDKRGARKYIKEQTMQRYMLDIEKIERAEKCDGYYRIITNTKLTPKQILEQYHTLWKVEETFRTLKNYLEIRPVFHWTKKRIIRTYSNEFYRLHNAEDVRIRIRKKRYRIFT